MRAGSSLTRNFFTTFFYREFDRVVRKDFGVIRSDQQVSLRHGNFESLPWILGTQTV